MVCVSKHMVLSIRNRLINTHYRKTFLIPGIDVGGGWRTGCGSHPQSAERVEELEESVWSVVRQENEREDQEEGVQNSGKTNTDVRGRDMGVEEGTGK